MAYYNYKRVRDLIPDDFRSSFEAKWKEETGRNFEGTADYDGDLWIMAAEFIESQRDSLRKVKALRENLSPFPDQDELLQFADATGHLLAGVK